MRAAWCAVGACLVGAVAAATSSEAAPWLERALVGAVGPQCHESLFVAWNFERDCVEKLVAKLLGVAITAGAFMVKVPQLLSNVQAGATEGLVPSAVLLEALSNAWTVSYNALRAMPLTSYGESIAILVQNTILLTLFVLLPARKGAAPAVSPVSALIWGTAFVLLAGLPLALPLYVVPTLGPADLLRLVTRPAGSSWGLPAADNDALLGMLRALFLTSSGFFAISRLQQIIGLASADGPGGLSGVTAFMQFAGASARVFTSLKEAGGDTILTASFASAAILNGIIFGQFLYLTYTKKQKKE
jgi:mannose-P-dolichol utilization defect protein 1